MNTAKTVKSSVLLWLIIPAAWLLSSDNTNPLTLGAPRMIYLVGKRRDGIISEDEQGESVLSPPRQRDRENSSSGLQVSTQVGLHQACIIQPCTCLWFISNLRSDGACWLSTLVAGGEVVVTSHKQTPSHPEVPSSRQRTPDRLNHPSLEKPIQRSCFEVTEDILIFSNRIPNYYNQDL